MYETSFGFKDRPFTVSPSSTCFFQSAEHQNALDELLVTITSLNGIAILTGDAGTGKTAICQQVISRLESQFQIHSVEHCNFPTVRALLQTLVYGLTEAYEKASEQELRLALKTEIHSSYLIHHQPILIIVDEAHLLNDQFLEELRVLSDISIDGQPGLQLLLSGQTALEETLFQSSLSSLSQRIGCQVFLEKMTRQESEQYIEYRLNRVATVERSFFSDDAVKFITHVSDGLPRCLNQICDHGLMLAYVQDSPLVDELMAREAFHDLQQLPLHWNDPLPAASPLEELRSVSHADEIEIESISTEDDSEHEIDDFMDDRLNQLVESDFMETELDSDDSSWDSNDVFSLGDDIEAIEIGSGQETASDCEETISMPRQELESESECSEVDEFVSLDTDEVPITDATDGFTQIIDRYAAIDAGIDPEMLPEVTVPNTSLSDRNLQLIPPKFDVSAKPADAKNAHSKVQEPQMEQVPISEFNSDLDLTSETSDVRDKNIPAVTEPDFDQAHQDSTNENVYQALAQEISMDEETFEEMLAAQVFEVCSETRKGLLDSLNEILSYPDLSEEFSQAETGEPLAYDIVLPEEEEINESEFSPLQSQNNAGEQENSEAKSYRLDSYVESEKQDSANARLKGPAMTRYKNLFSRLRRKQELSER